MVKKLTGQTQSNRELARSSSNGRSTAYDEVDDRILIPFGATATPTATVRSGIDKYRTLSGRAAAASTPTASTSSTPTPASTSISSFKKDLVAAVRHNAASNSIPSREPPEDRAQKLVARRQFAAALPLYTEALQQGGGGSQTKLQLFFQRGSCALSARRYQQAVDDFTQVIELTPSNFVLLAKRAKAYAALHEHAKALRDYSDAIAMTPPTHPELRALLLARAAVHQLMGETTLALDDLAHAQTTTSGGERDPELFYQRAQLRVQCRQLGHAVEDLGRFIELQQDQDGWREDHHSGDDEEERSGGGEDEADNHQRLVEVRLERAELLRKLATAAEEQHRSDEEAVAAEEGEQQPLLGHQHSTGNYHTSSSSSSLSSPPSSAKRRRRPSPSSPYELLATSAASRAKQAQEWVVYRGPQAVAFVERAIEDYTAVLAVDAAHVDALRYRGESFALLGRPEEALGDFDAALGVDPNEFKVQMAKAKLLFATQRAGEAIAELTSVLQRNGFFVDALFLRAEMLAEQGELLHASADYTAIVDGHLDAASPTVVTTMEKRGGGGAISSTTAGGKVTNEYAVHALLLRARVRQRLHDYEGAAGDYRRILESSPNDVDAQLELQDNDVKKAAYEKQREEDALAWLAEKEREEQRTGGDGVGGGAGGAAGGGSTTPSATSATGSSKSKKKKKKKNKSKAAAATLAAAASTTAVSGEEELVPLEDVEDVEEFRREDDATRIERPEEERPPLSKKASAVSIVVTRDEACESMWEEQVEEPLRFKRGASAKDLFTPRIDTGSLEEGTEDSSSSSVLWVPHKEEDEDEEEPDVEEPTPLEVESSPPLEGGEEEDTSGPSSPPASVPTTPSHVAIRERLVDEKYLKKRQKQLDKLRTQLGEACSSRDRSALGEMVERAERKGMADALGEELALARRVLLDLEEERRRAEEDRAKQARYRQQEQDRERRREDEMESHDVRSNGTHASDDPSTVPSSSSSSSPSTPSLVIRPIAYGHALHLAEQHQQQILQFQRLLQEKDAEIAFLRSQLASSSLPAAISEEESGGSPPELLLRPLRSPAFEAASRRADALVQWMGPSAEAEEVRVRILSFVRRVVEHHWASAMGGPPLLLVPTGSYPMKTYLPTADLDVCLFVPPELEPTWHFAVMNALCLAGGEDAVVNGSPDSGSKPSSSPLPSTHTVRNVSFINAEVRVIKCTVDNVAVDVTANRVGALGALLLLDAMDQRVGEGHLLKRSVVLIKSWCIHESGAYTSGGGGGGGVLGASQGALSTYAINTIVMSLFNEHRIASPLHALLLFLDKMATFPWHEAALTLFGAVPLGLLATSASLGDALQRLHAKAPPPAMNVMALEDVDGLRRHVHDQFGGLDPTFTPSSSSSSAAPPSGSKAGGGGGSGPSPTTSAPSSAGPASTSVGSSPPATVPSATTLPSAVKQPKKMFPIRACNVVDPVDDRNNLARSVSHDAFPAMKRAFTLGRHRLARLLLRSPPPADDSLDDFFTNCWREYGKGDGWRPDLLVHPRQIWHTRSANGGAPPSSSSPSSPAAAEDDPRWQTMLPEYLLPPSVFAPLFAPHHPLPHHHHAYHPYQQYHHARQYPPYYMAPPYAVNGGGGGGGAGDRSGGERTSNGHLYSPGHRTASTSSPSAYKSSPRRAQSLPGPSSTASLAAVAAAHKSGGGPGGATPRRSYDSPTLHKSSNKQ